MFKASRTPFDDMGIMQVRESCAREVAEIEEANRARKRAEQLVNKLPSVSQQEKAWSIMEKISSGEPDNTAAWRKLGDSILYCHRFRRKVARQELQGRCCAEKLMGGHGGSAQIHARFWRYRWNVWQQGKDENPLRRFRFGKRR